MRPAYDRRRGRWSEPVLYDLYTFAADLPPRHRRAEATSVADAIKALETELGHEVLPIDCHPAAPNELHRRTR